MPEFGIEIATHTTTDRARDARCEPARREYVSPTVESLGTWQAVALASSLLGVTRQF